MNSTSCATLILACAALTVILFSNTVNCRYSKHYRNGRGGYEFIRRSKSIDANDQEKEDDVHTRWPRPVEAESSRTIESTERQNLTGLRLANAHLQKIRANHRCGHPRPKLVHVKDFYANAEKTYLPRCTVIHKCDDESGCCESDSLHCVAKSQQTVSLFFYVLFVNGSSVEMLTFTNDTDCECREVNNEPRVMELQPQTTTPAVVTFERAVAAPSPQMADYYAESRPKTSPSIEYVQQNKGKEQLCSHIDCPNPFAAQLVTKHPPHKCSCDCAEQDVLCSRTKKGLKRLSSLEARCVTKAICLEPTCEYGEYEKTKGLCPRKTSDNQKPFHLRHQKHHAYERD